MMETAIISIDCLADARPRAIGLKEKPRAKMTHGEILTLWYVLFVGDVLSAPREFIADRVSPLLTARTTHGFAPNSLGRIFLAIPLLFFF